jgi:hypothetical protein
MRNPIGSHPQCTANRARASAAGISRCRVDARELQPLHAQNFLSRAPQVNDATAAATVPNGGYLRAATDHCQLQNVTASLGLHSGLRGRHAAVTAGYHLSKRHWNIVTLDGSVANAEVLELIGHALVAHLTKAQRSRLIT